MQELGLHEGLNSDHDLKTYIPDCYFLLKLLTSIAPSISFSWMPTATLINICCGRSATEKQINKSLLNATPETLV